MRQILNLLNEIDIRDFEIFLSQIMDFPSILQSDLSQLQNTKTVITLLEQCQDNLKLTQFLFHALSQNLQNIQNFMFLYQSSLQSIPPFPELLTLLNQLLTNLPSALPESATQQFFDTLTNFGIFKFLIMIGQLAGQTNIIKAQRTQAIQLLKQLVSNANFQQFTDALIQQQTDNTATLASQLLNGLQPAVLQQVLNLLVSNYSTLHNLPDILGGFKKLRCDASINFAVFIQNQDYKIRQTAISALPNHLGQLDVILDRNHDIQYSVRVEMLNKMENILENSESSAINLPILTQIMNCIIERCQDEKVFVRKAAFSLLKTLISHNPFGGVLDQVVFEHLINQQRAALQATPESAEIGEIILESLLTGQQFVVKIKEIVELASQTLNEMQVSEFDSFLDLINVGIEYKLECCQKIVPRILQYSTFCSDQLKAKVFKFLLNFLIKTEELDAGKLTASTFVDKLLDLCLSYQDQNFLAQILNELFKSADFAQTFVEGKKPLLQFVIQKLINLILMLEQIQEGELSKRTVGYPVVLVATFVLKCLATAYNKCLYDQGYRCMNNLIVKLVQYVELAYGGDRFVIQIVENLSQILSFLIRPFYGQAEGLALPPPLVESYAQFSRFVIQNIQQLLAMQFRTVLVLYFYNTKIQVDQLYGMMSRRCQSPRDTAIYMYYCGLLSAFLNDQYYQATHGGNDGNLQDIATITAFKNQDEGNIFEDYSYLLNAADACAQLSQQIIKRGRCENAVMELNVSLQAVGLFLCAMPPTHNQLKQKLLDSLVDVSEILLGLQKRRQSPELLSLLSTLQIVCESLIVKQPSDFGEFVQIFTDQGNFENIQNSLVTQSIVIYNALLTSQFVKIDRRTNSFCQLLKHKQQKVNLVELVKVLSDKKVAGLNQFLMDTAMYLGNEMPCSAEFQEIFSFIFEQFGDAKVKERMIKGGLTGPWAEFLQKV